MDIIYEKDKKTLLAGPLPKPIGGVSIHTFRLYKLLRNKGYDISIFNLNKRLIKGTQWVLLIVKLIFFKYEVLHLQGYEGLFYSIILFICRIKKTKLILTLHNPEFGHINKRFVRHVNKTDLVIAVGEHIIEEYQKQNIVFDCDIKVISPFLPPDEDRRDAIESTYSQELLDFIKSNNKVILVSAYRLIQVDNDIDLYGIDKSIKLLNELVKEVDNIGLIIAIADNDYNIEYLNKLKQDIVDLKLDKNVFFIEGQKEIWPLFSKINLFLRPTYYDGYGISVAEALHYNCNALASNVCKRADGAILYNYFDFNDFKNKAISILNNEETN